MRIIIIGLGSMGRRRIRNLESISGEIEIIGVDARDDRRLQAEEEFGISTSNDLDKVLLKNRPDCAVISTSPLSHGSIIEKCLSAGCNVFTELNLSEDMYESNIMLAKHSGKVLFLSSTFLYRKEIIYISQQVAAAVNPVNYIYHVGQYLPDWHPWEAIDDYFISHKKTNGCREILAIELPWMCKAFGEVKKIEVNKRKTTQLSIDYNDTYQLILEHENGGLGMLSVDVVSRKPVRNLEIYNEELYIAWNGTPETLFKYDIETNAMKPIILYDDVDKQNGYAGFVIENAYKSELEEFLNEVRGRSKPPYTFEDDLRTLKLISEIEGAREC